ncbi:uncharacterized protein LOC111377321 [Olea europaea var. sylvestris]|uniref:uncharacterized protein LOC111377321 n=1 Tax=Olea europaea var. sylvestris TaxID=158386 RepID=UPI000C1D1F07|nr:uncharacterized protein LOC111377321 [Olea europaea var. sylvestris]
MVKQGKRRKINRIEENRTCFFLAFASNIPYTRRHTGECQILLRTNAKTILSSSWHVSFKGRGTIVQNRCQVETSCVVLVDEYEYEVTRPAEGWGQRTNSRAFFSFFVLARSFQIFAFPLDKVQEFSQYFLPLRTHSNYDHLLRSYSKASTAGKSTIFSGTKSGDEDDEFVETQYYKELESIDKQHRTTGNGFMKRDMEKSGNEEHFQLRGSHGTNGGFKQTIFKTNPATNDWIPSFEDHQVEYISSKPNRSESC